MSRHNRKAALGGIAVLGVFMLAACSPGTAQQSTEGAAASNEIVFWDPYPQHTDGSDWDKHVKACAPEGTTIIRSSAPQTDLFNQLTTAVKEDNAPDVAILDNPMMPEAAGAGLMAPIEEVGLTADGVDANLLGPGIVDGVTYGIPIGSNALGLYYNEDILSEAGVDPESITDWASLNAALEKVVSSGAKGITFSGIAGEEGVFQFLPWFWGAGGDLSDLSSPQAIAAGELLSSWVANGYAPKSVVTDNQTNAWDLFITGDYGFAENGSWFAGDAAAASFPIGVIPIPAKDGGVAPVATGGEFLIAPIHKADSEAHYKNATAVISCMTQGEAGRTSAQTLGHLSARAELRAEQVKEDPTWNEWVDAVENAKGRTTDLGAGYVEASAKLSEALQGALNAAGNTEEVKAAFENIK